MSITFTITWLYNTKHEKVVILYQKNRTWGGALGLEKTGKLLGLILLLNAFILYFSGIL